MARPRDPLSVRYDGAVSDILARAARASRQRKAVQAWISSPRAEFHDLDESGRTRHERAFLRSAYHQIRGQHIADGTLIQWSLQLTWGGNDALKPSRPGHFSRPVSVRLRPSGDARVTGERYIPENPMFTQNGR